MSLIDFKKRKVKNVTAEQNIFQAILKWTSKS